MRFGLANLAALPLIAASFCAFAQTTDGAQTANGTQAASPETGSTATPPGHYSGTDTAGKREHVKANYGGNNQAAADAKERPITEQLNEEALKAAAPSP